MMPIFNKEKGEWVADDGRADHCTSCHDDQDLGVGYESDHWVYDAEGNVTPETKCCCCAQFRLYNIAMGEDEDAEN